ncbi:helix-turn-helix domain-containing protein [Paenibacillus sp. MAH-36]|uniref:AraC family transcriptional regulator n=1 Tax=Paenibacillus violae TaxID=3077234 RepID=A0ABU3RPM7_9BACL|nr:AraC family transcriptional regulator [Paenibacillus sp. PFR10]MDU0205797.1 AraC family transcriptional regulator [Paenibacillus sp. PFR10]
MTIFSLNKSLFRHVLTSFIVLILIFSSFSLLIFWMLKSHLRSEMIEQNHLTLQKVAERYQFQLDKIREALFKQFTDKDVITLNNQVNLKKDAESLTTRPIVLDIQSIVGDSELYLDNMILLFRSANLAINKFGPGTNEELFAGLYASNPYPVSYWQSQFQRTDNFVLHPAAGFGATNTDPTDKTLIPYSIKPALADNMLIAMIDADRLRDAMLKENPNLDLTIVGPGQDLIYQTNRSSAAKLPETLFTSPPTERAYLLEKGIYYVDYQNEDRMHFIMRVTNPDFAGKILRLDNLMIILLGISIFIAFVVSIFFSKRINHPVRQLLKEKGQIQQELKEQQSELTNYHFINKLKNINLESGEWPHIQGTEETYTIVLYELRYRAAAFVAVPMSKEQISQSVGAQLKQFADETIPGSHTFQIEHHQFLSVFPGNERDRIIAMLAQLKQVLDQDKRYCLVTAAVSSAFEHSIQFGYAYRQVNEMAMQARLLDETQTITEFRSDRSTYVLTLSQEQELTAVLKAGKEQETLDLFLPWLQELNHKEASVDVFRHMTLAVTDKAKMVLEHYKVQTEALWQLKPLLLQLDECCTLAEYEFTFQAYFRAVTQIIREKKEANDPIVDRVLRVIHEQFAEDLSLDVLADQLNLSTSYLSTYIKEKTGANFMEHLHDRRVSNAKELLHSTDLNIQEISIQVGYRNISSFNRMFKNRTGSSPGEYRKTKL